MWLRLGCLIFLICVAAPSYAEIDPVVQWRKEVRDRLIASKRFPPEARDQTSSATVGFVLDRSGKLVSSWLRESTGVPALDAEALAIIDRAQPFPALPPKAADDQLKLGIQFVFSDGPDPDNPDRIKEEAAINAKMRSICRGC
jgi:periplasmic protein TonB